MAIPTPPLRTELADTYPNPSNAGFKAGIGKLWDFLLASGGILEVMHLGAWTSTAISLAPSSGTFSNANATLYYRKIGLTVQYTIEANIIAKGTGTGSLFLYPTTGNATRRFAFAGRDGTSGKMIQGFMAPDSNQITVLDYANASIIADGVAVIVSGTYQATA